ncbi:MAG: 50S ribosomal protein L3 [Candidatus Levybacteria bacterium]|nr:50S ribosomal protein L3 [Candidatus Levybacteria bacterium]
MIQAFFGSKKQQTQLFLTDGTRIPVTLVRVADMPVIQVKTKDKEGYSALQLGVGVGKKKHWSKALLGHLAKAKLPSFPKKIVEIRLLADETVPTVGELVRVADVLKTGDIVSVTGTSKGKGFAGGVKRYQFKGGPRTHGQSNRERAPGSLGQTTTPGRVYRGKRMAGHMGQDTVTLKNLLIVAVVGDTVYIKGLLPGAVNSIVRVRKTGESNKFVAPLLGEEKKEEQVEEQAVGVEAAQETVSEERVEDEASENSTAGEEKEEHAKNESK